ncbi:hypothetical protein BST81_04235 [Leptolyngbya sp. 'hensonii']|uniref:response regulator n=1 Tax=Leptolyngbya sp. 'hensonii' TaxID=1922337 RepID=UPI00094FCC13|nr:response regulator [Leptolyngbya sp. 'hensonii']OLP19749.1 hypothetical protein BST81_04235 [Leptolyngbya sp. 'hensonii']
MRILLVEDDRVILDLLTATLAKQNYIVDVAMDGEVGWELAESMTYDLLLLDVMLPKLDGISFCRRLRQKKNEVLVMLLTARDTTTDKMLGLDSGADDYVVKPFNAQELAARIRALLRRRSATPATVLTCGQLRLDTTTRDVTYNGKPLRFSRKEYLLLELLLQNQQQVFSRSTIVDRLWSLGEEPPDEDTIKSHVKNIRRQLRAVGAIDLIETLYGQGYRINPAYLTEVNPPQEVTPAQEHTVNLVISEIWERTKGVSFERVRLLEQAAQSLKSGALEPTQRQKAIQAAHKLIGSLGTFGFEAGSVLAQQIEAILQSEAEPESIVDQVESLVQALRQALGTSEGMPDQRTGMEAPSLSPEESFPLPVFSLAPRPITEELNGQSVGSHSVEADQPLLLIIDQDVDLAEQLVAEALAWKIRTAIASTLDTAREYLLRQHPHIVLLDVALTGNLEEGRAFLARLTTDYPEVRVVVFSNHDGSADRISMVNSGAQIFLPKPIAPTEVLQAITEVLQLSEPLDAKVLAVDDDPQILALTRSILEPQGLQVTCLQDAGQFWEILKSTQPDLLILDVDMLVFSGLELCQSVRQDFQWNWLPVLFLSVKNDSATLRQLFNAGADDYISKPIVPDELLNRVCNRLKRSRLLRNQAQTDALTGVANRQQATQAMNQLLRLAAHSQQPVCLTVLDLDYFKQVNDQYGHIQGDRVLRQFGQFLKRKFRLGDVVARWGGEEFVLGLYGMTRSDGVERVAEVLEEWRSIRAETCNEASTTSDECLGLATFSAGIAQYPIDGINLQLLYRSADAALYRAKIAGRDRVLAADWQPLTVTYPLQADVLFVHPPDEFSSSIQRALETRGYHVHYLESSKEAVALLKRRDPKVTTRVLLLASYLSDMEGLEVLKQLGSRIVRRIRTILLLDQAETAEKIRDLGAYDYLLVPCSPLIVMRCLRQAMKA